MKSLVYDMAERFRACLVLECERDYANLLLNSNMGVLVGMISVPMSMWVQ